MIEARHLQKCFGEVTAVRDVSFTAKDAAVTGLLGPNGAGKTTTMRMLGTLVRPTSGTALADGIDLTAIAESLLMSSRRPWFWLSSSCFVSAYSF